MKLATITMNEHRMHRVRTVLLACTCPAGRSASSSDARLAARRSPCWMQLLRSDRSSTESPSVRFLSLCASPSARVPMQSSLLRSWRDSRCRRTARRNVCKRPGDGPRHEAAVGLRSWPEFKRRFVLVVTAQKTTGSGHRSCDRAFSKAGLHLVQRHRHPVQAHYNPLEQDRRFLGGSCHEKIRGHFHINVEVAVLKKPIA